MDGPKQVLTLPNAKGIAREIYKAGQHISGEKRWWNKTEVGRFDLDKANLNITKEENNRYKMTGNGLITYRFSDEPHKVTSIDGQLIGSDIIPRSIECGRACYRDGKLTFNTASPESSTFPANVIGGDIIEVHVARHSHELQIRISVWEGFRTEVSVRCLEQNFRLTAVFLEVGFSNGTCIVPFLGLPYERLQASVEVQFQQFTFDIIENTVYVSQYSRKEQRWVFPVEKLWSTLDWATRDPSASASEMLARFESHHLDKNNRLLWPTWFFLLLSENESNRRLSPSGSLIEPPSSGELPLPEEPQNSRTKTVTIKKAPNKLPVAAQEQLERYAKMHKETGGFNLTKYDLRDNFFRKHKICTVDSNAIKPQMEAKLLEYINFYIHRQGEAPVANIPKPP